MRAHMTVAKTMVRVLINRRTWKVSVLGQPGLSGQKTCRIRSKTDSDFLSDLWHQMGCIIHQILSQNPLKASTVPAMLECDRENQGQPKRDAYPEPLVFCFPGFLLLLCPHLSLSNPTPKALFSSPQNQFIIPQNKSLDFQAQALLLHATTTFPCLDQLCPWEQVMKGEH